ncbi:LysR substrate-binding domain-containing protein [Vibrio tritonius]|uniref:LysR substrate-binding domain-containing protein n=1 Tax=Vibrio tritonius TaxID=1435069 RepID=UPI000839A2CC|nr:LysR substrate-binding domain-containing protein [Vibrio tritonius]
MPIHHKSIPSLSALIFFEASARLGTFTKASKELHISPTAVAKQIKQLEHFLDVTLFYRRKRGLELTNEGEQYLVHVTQALSILSDAGHRMKHPSQSQALNLEIGTCFSHFWLIPRLDDFRSRFPNINLNISINNERNMTQHGLPSYDVAFYYAPIDSEQKENYLLFDERMLLVCSPDFLAKNPECRDLSKLWQQPLLGIKDAPSFWESWQSWAQNTQLKYQSPTQMMLMEDQIGVIQAAINDAGIALAWDWHIAELLESEQLIALTPPVECYENAFFLSRSQVGCSDDAESFIHWVLEQLAVEKQLNLNNLA